MKNKILKNTFKGLVVLKKILVFLFKKIEEVISSTIYKLEDPRLDTLLSNKIQKFSQENAATSTDQ